MKAQEKSSKASRILETCVTGNELSIILGWNIQKELPKISKSVWFCICKLFNGKVKEFFFQILLFKFQNFNDIWKKTRIELSKALLNITFDIYRTFISSQIACDSYLCKGWYKKMDIIRECFLTDLRLTAIQNKIMLIHFNKQATLKGKKGKKEKRRHICKFKQFFTWRRKRKKRRRRR